MAALTASRTIETQVRGGREAYVVEDAEVLYAGALVGTTAAGFLAAWNNIATTRFEGICLETVTGDTSASPNVFARVDTTGPTLRGVAVAGATQAGVNALVYCQTDNIDDLTLTPATSPAIGRLKYFRTASDCDVQLFTPFEAEAKI